ncbi:MAG TPA: S8 family serine peptidase [Candidatus Limnocylindrales bacterium]|nr:S8 family serine peptidase [Candidatus Limnocylindrales bacterium]
MRRSIVLIAASALVLSVGSPASATPARVDAAGPGADTAPANGPADPTGRWIVRLRDGADAAASADRQGRRLGFKADRTFEHALRGFTAKLDRAQVASLRADPAVEEIVPDEKIELTAQKIPTGISRINAIGNPLAAIDGVDDRVDADVAIVDTGIALHPDLNVVGGYNCATSAHGAWRDVYGHGTHVAGTVGALDNGSGVVGVAPGVRLWAVRILNDNGDGLLSWYVCGLDWIAAQRDPVDPTRPLIEAVNMSVTKWGSDDRACGTKNNDILHAAICRLVGTGVTVVAAAANDAGNASKRVPAAYNEVITVSALADTDGKPGSLGGHLCYSWGSYDGDDTFANFSNYGSDVDLIAPGKCIWSTIPGGYAYMSGTSMAAPHVTGAVALLKSTRPDLSPAEVKGALQYLGSDNWKRFTDPDSSHEKLLDLSRLGPRGDFDVADAGTPGVGEAGGVAQVPVVVTRTPTSFERIDLRAGDLPSGFTTGTGSTFGFGTQTARVPVHIPAGTRTGTYDVTIRADEHGNVHTTTGTIQVVQDDPTVGSPTARPTIRARVSGSLVPTTITWPAATDPTSPIGAYQLDRSVDGGAWTAVGTTTSSGLGLATSERNGSSYRYRVRAADIAGNWSPYAIGPIATPTIVQNSSSSVHYSGSWHRAAYKYALGGSTTWSTSISARATLRFTGRAVSYVTPVGTTKGSARIWVDGVYRGKVSLRATANGNARILFTATFGSGSTHTIVIAPSSSARIDLDAFVIRK